MHQKQPECLEYYFVKGSTSKNIFCLSCYQTVVYYVVVSFLNLKNMLLIVLVAMVTRIMSLYA